MLGLINIISDLAINVVKPAINSVDILVEEKSLSKALKALKNQLNIVKEERNYHDVTLILDNGVVIELHFTLSENDERLDKITEDCFNNLEKESYFSSNSSLNLPFS